MFSRIFLLRLHFAGRWSRGWSKRSMAIKAIQQDQKESLYRLRWPVRSNQKKRKVSSCWKSYVVCWSSGEHWGASILSLLHRQSVCCTLQPSCDILVLVLEYKSPKSLLSLLLLLPLLSLLLLLLLLLSLLLLLLLLLLCENEKLSSSYILHLCYIKYCI